MKGTLGLLLSFSILLWVGCGSPQTSSSAEEHDHAEQAHDDHHFNESTDPLMLNDGEHWLVNDEMKPFVQNGEELVNVYLTENQSDYDRLATELRSQNQQLIQSCTMTGKSHDELHKWLHPHMALVEELAASATVEEARNRVDELQHSYQQYHAYFQ